METYSTKNGADSRWLDKYKNNYWRSFDEIPTIAKYTLE